MDLVEFSQQFSTETAYEERLIGIRWPTGFFCPKCSSHNAMHVHTAHRCNRFKALYFLSANRTATHKFGVRLK